MEKLIAVFSTLLLFTPLWRLNECCLSLSGSSLEFAEISSRRQGVFDPSTNIIAPGLSFTCHGHVTSWQAYMERTRGSIFEAITFQVWRPSPLLSSSNCSFELIGSHTVERYRVMRDNVVDTSTVVDPTLTPIPVEPGDVVGVYVEDGTSGVQEYTDSSLAYITMGDIDGVSVVDFCTGAVTSNVGAPIVSAVVVEVPTVMATTPTASTAASTTFRTTTSTVTTPSVTTPITAETATPTMTSPASSTGVSSSSMSSTSATTTPTNSGGGGSTTVDMSSGTAVNNVSSSTTTTTTTATTTTTTATTSSETSTGNGIGNVGGLMTDAPAGGRGELSLYTAAAIGGVVMLLATLLCTVCVYCCVVRVRKRKNNLRCNRHPDQLSSEAGVELNKLDKTKSLDSRFEASNIYSTVGSPLQDPDLSYAGGGSCLKTLNSLEYEVPVTLSRDVSKKRVLSAYNKQSVDWNASSAESRVKPPGNHPAPGRRKAHPRKRPSIPAPPIPTQPARLPVAKKTKALLEASGVYEVPIGAGKGSSVVVGKMCEDTYDEPNCVVQYTAQQTPATDHDAGAGGRGNSSPSSVGGADEDYTAMDLVVDYAHVPLDSAEDSIYELI